MQVEHNGAIGIQNENSKKDKIFFMKNVNAKKTCAG